MTFSLFSREQAEQFSQEFLADWGFEKLHFWPMLLRQKNLSRRLQEVADYEYLKFSLTSDSGLSVTPKPHLALHPSLQVILIQAAALYLGKEPGVYLLWKTERGLHEKRATEEEALFLDKLRDDQVIFPEDLNQQERMLASQLRELGLII